MDCGRLYYRSCIIKVCIKEQTTKEGKQCKQTRNANMEEHGQTKIASYAQNMESVNLQKGDKMAVIKRYLRLEPEQKVFVVFASKREGYKDNIVLRCNVRECSIRKNTTIYYLVKEKVVLGKKDIKPFIDCFSCENANIDTGYRGMQTDIYPVFTTKEKCIEWLKN